MKLHDAGVLDDRDDVFFLDRAQLARVVLDRADLRQVIAGRRAERRRNQEAVPPPPVVVGRFDRNEDRSISAEPADTTQTILRGIAVSPGRVTGPARVILRATEDDHVRPGEILVAPFTDPGWTPYFVTAAGIVMDTGGLLSHGSIVAREYGIPAVVNVGHATTMIRTGQMIEVDGNRGVVQLLDKQSALSSG